MWQLAGKQVTEINTDSFLFYFSVCTFTAAETSKWAQYSRCGGFRWANSTNSRFMATPPCSGSASTRRAPCPARFRTTRQQFLITRQSFLEGFWITVIVMTATSLIPTSWPGASSRWPVRSPSPETITRFRRLMAISLLYLEDSLLAHASTSATCAPRMAAHSTGSN